MTLKVASAKEDVFFRPSALWTPEYLDYFSAWFEHGPFAFWLTDALRPRCFVELGTHAGYSYFCFCQAVQRLHLGTSCYAVDTWTGDEHSGLYGEDVFGAVTKHNQLYTSFSTLIRSTFDDALSYFPDKSIDLLHIDGRHFYEDVRHDFESWRGKLTDDAIILFHDTNVRERQFGVWKLFEEIKQSHATFEFMHGHGLGMVALNKIPPVLKLLFAMDAAATNEWRQAFATLGNSVTQKWQAHVMQLQLQDQIASHEQEKLQAQHDLTRLQEQLQTLIQKNEQILKINEKAMLAALLGLNHKVQQRRSWLEKACLRLQAFFSPSKVKLSAVRTSLFFDADWYLTTYPDVAAAGADPAQHYLDYGAGEGRDPGPLFSTSEYFGRNANIARAHLNPLVHISDIGIDDNQTKEFEDYSFDIKKSLAELQSGNHVSPDHSSGYAYLNATRATLTRTRVANRASKLSAEAAKVAIIVHAFFVDIFIEILDYLGEVDPHHHVFVTTTSNHENEIRSILIERRIDHTIFVCENRGRDVFPFLQVMRQIDAATYPFVLKLHTKKSVHLNYGDQWRRKHLECLATPSQLAWILKQMCSASEIGLVGASDQLISMNEYMGLNHTKLRWLAIRLGIHINDIAAKRFITGTMFVARRDALDPLLSLGFLASDFEEEAGQIDGTMAHAIERALTYSAISAGFEVASIGADFAANKTPLAKELLI